jgi:AcrR family transcriptional regulator
MNNTREHILNVAFNLFLQKSFKEVTLKDIVEKTEMSKGAFYHYFTSKEQLFLELVNNVFSSILDIPYDRFSKESLYNFYIDYVNYYVENLKHQSNGGDNAPSFNYISLVFDAIKLFPDFQEKLLLSKQVQLQAWREVIHAARERGEIKSSMSDEQIANIFINSSGGVEINSVYEGRSEDIGRDLLNLWDGFYKAIKS